jgi:YidC/Oxa1 family membrane protein insertase
MFTAAFHLLIFDPLYNGLVFLISVVPFADVGIAVILLTALVKLALFPLSQKATKEQHRMRELAPQMDAIKEEYKDDKQKQTLKIMEFYREQKVRPFLSLLVILIQLPIIFGLYWVFFKGGLPNVNPDLLYYFTPAPGSVNMEFLGLVDMAGHSIVLALMAGASQFAHSLLALPKPKPKSKNPTLKEDLAHSFHLQMKYVMPVVVTFIAYTISSAIALYWLTSNIFTIGQELWVRRKKRMGDTHETLHHGKAGN